MQVIVIVLNIRGFACLDLSIKTVCWNTNYKTKFSFAESDQSGKEATVAHSLRRKLSLLVSVVF